MFIHSHLKIKVTVYAAGGAREKAVSAANIALMNVVKELGREGYTPVKPKAKIEGHEEEEYEYGWLRLDVNGGDYRATASGDAYINAAKLNMCGPGCIAAVRGSALAIRLGRIVTVLRPLIAGLANKIVDILIKVLGLIWAAITIKEVITRSGEAVAREAGKGLRESLSKPVTAIAIAAIALILLSDRGR